MAVAGSAVVAGNWGGKVWSSTAFNMVVLVLIISNFAFTVQELQNTDPRFCLPRTPTQSVFQLLLSPLGFAALLSTNSPSSPAARYPPSQPPPRPPLLSPLYLAYPAGILSMRGSTWPTLSSSVQVPSSQPAPARVRATCIMLSWSGILR